jgi:hypothetical protein
VERSRYFDRYREQIERAAWEEWLREITRWRIRISRRMPDIVSERLDQVEPEEVLLNQVPRWV